MGLYAEEEQRETAAFEPAPSVPDSTRGGCGDCLSPSSLEAVPSVKEAMCEERSSSSGSAGPSLGTSSPHPTPRPLASSPLHTRQGRQGRLGVGELCSQDLLYTGATQF